MIIKFIKWFQGYLFVVIKGYSPERFINLCSARNILLWNIRKTHKGYEFNISVKGFKQLKPIIRKTRTRPFVQKKVGLPFLFFRYKKRKGFFIGILLFFLVIYILSLHIWDIDISGQYSHTEEAILEYLETVSVYSGIRKSKLDCQEIEETIRKEYSDIGWVSAEIRGTRLLIKVTETNMPTPVEAPLEPCHLIASRDGVITSIVTRKGTPMVKAGDVVKKGDILVSGIINVMGDFEVILEKETVVADADVLMQSNYSYHSVFSLEYIQKVYKKKSYKKYGISFFNKNIFLYNPLKKMKLLGKYDIIVNEKQMRLSNTFYLPVKGVIKEYMEYQEQTNKFTKSEATALATEDLNRYVIKLNEKGVLIIENHVKILIDKNQCKASGTLLVEAMEKSHRKIHESEWRIKEE